MHKSSNYKQPVTTGDEGHVTSKIQSFVIIVQNPRMEGKYMKIENIALFGVLDPESSAFSKGKSYFLLLAPPPGWLSFFVNLHSHW